MKFLKKKLAMSNYPLNTPLSFLTIGDFLEILKQAQIKENPTNKDFSKKEYAYGLIGLAKVLGCSKTTAWKIKKTGVLDRAISQRGRKIIVDKNLAIKLYDKKNENKQ